LAAAGRGGRDRREEREREFRCRPPPSRSMPLLSVSSSAPSGMQLLADDGGAAAAAKPLPHDGGANDELVHTRSALADLESGLSLSQARTAQNQRKQLRVVDAELSELRAECVRREILRGPSGRRYTSLCSSLALLPPLAAFSRQPKHVQAALRRVCRAGWLR
jgi:hypothetical protein